MQGITLMVLTILVWHVSMPKHTKCYLVFSTTFIIITYILLFIGDDGSFANIWSWTDFDLITAWDRNIRGSPIWLQFIIQVNFWTTNVNLVMALVDESEAQWCLLNSSSNPCCRCWDISLDLNFGDGTRWNIQDHQSNYTTSGALLLQWDGDPYNTWKTSNFWITKVIWFILWSWMSFHMSSSCQQTIY